MSEHDGKSEAPHDGTSNRREFLKRSTAGFVSMSIGIGGIQPGDDPHEEGPIRSTFRSRWPAGVTRTWIGPEYWSNPLQDWRISDGRLELITDGRDRNVHILTRGLSQRAGTLEMRAVVSMLSDNGSAGFYLGVRGPLGEYRNSAIHGRGLKVGIANEGRLFIGEDDLSNAARRDPSSGEEAQAMLQTDGLHLLLRAAPSGSGYVLTLSAHDVETGEQVASPAERFVAEDRMHGNLALFGSGSDSDKRGEPWLSFRDLRVDGTKIDAHPDRSFGPVLFAQYTLSRGILKMTAQMAPLGADEDRTVRLEIDRGSGWNAVDEQQIDSLARTATFRVAHWDASREVPYRIVYRLREGAERRTHYFHGTVRREPVEKRSLVMGVLSCATHAVFPNIQVAYGLQHHDPDLLAFTGDQFYESSGGYGVERRRDDVPLSTLDYLRKWYMHGWSFADVMRDRPTICITDDHDVFQGNLWGNGGRAATTMDQHNDGGYFMPAEWINMVERTQTSHLPDPYDPTPVQQDIGVYYTHMLYGRVSMAILEDRKWKSGPDGLIPPHEGRPDHITDPDFDPRSVDVPGAELLGRRQIAFLDEFATDWRGADAKVVVSQTIYASVANIHGRGDSELVADLDSNGWPQTPRNDALRRFRKGFAFHVGGDQHLPMIVRYGIDDHDDAGYIFCVPAVAAGYPRAFLPHEPGANRAPGEPEYAGRFFDGLGNRFTMLAVANPRRPYRERLLEEMEDKTSGYGILRIDKEKQTFTMEAWPLLSDPTNDHEQFQGWPRTVHLQDNYGRRPEAYLPTLSIRKAASPIIQIVDEEADEIVYTLRIRESTYRPKVFREGTYTIRVGDDGGWIKTIEGVQTTRLDEHRIMEVEL